CQIKKVGLLALKRLKERLAEYRTTTAWGYTYLQQTEWWEINCSYNKVELEAVGLLSRLWNAFEPLMGRLSYLTHDEERKDEYGILKRKETSAALDNCLPKANEKMY
ncbi:hypothetical protein CU097_002870, partial [Rhizopus azygosporus]